MPVPVRPDQLQQILGRIATARDSQFVREAIDGERMLDIRLEAGDVLLTFAP